MLIIACVLVVGLLYLGVWIADAIVKRVTAYPKEFDRVHVGMKVDEVARAVGQPEETYGHDDWPTRYITRDRLRTLFARRDIERVCLYATPNWGMYVFFDAGGIAREVIIFSPD
ncbi:MAG TPA: hypothetical protein VM221_09800 [Armatimonadota bacterium]|nr:hypothetical protein [Armatimonadota bacterium]